MQRIYGLSIVESQIYMMKLQNKSLQEIADYRNVSLQDVKNAMTRINSKIKEKSHPMNIITVNQLNEGLTRKAIANMCLRVLQADQKLTDFYEGTHTIALFGVSPDIGDTDFVVRNIYTKIDPLPHNELEAKNKAEQIYKMYLDLGGEPGKMGYGWVRWTFDKFMVKYDMY